MTLEEGSVDVPEDPSDTRVGEQEVTQLIQPSEKQRGPQQLRRSERIQNMSIQLL